jgi:hypothetical protein
MKGAAARMFLAVGLAAVIGAACTSARSPSATGVRPSSASRVPPSPSLSRAEPQAELTVDQARLRGKYRIKFVSLKFTFGGHPDKAATWLFKPRCESGPCDVLFRSLSGHYQTTLALVNGKYQGQRNIKGRCGGQRTTYSYNYTVEPVDAEMVGEEYVVTEVEGVLEGRTINNGGCLPGYEKAAVRGSLSGGRSGG